MKKVNLKTALKLFLSRFQKPSHFNSTLFSELNYVQSVHILKMSKYSITIRGPYIWNSFFSPEENYVQSVDSIKMSKYSISIRGPYIWNSFLSPEEKQITTMHKFKAHIFLEETFSIYHAL